MGVEGGQFQSYSSKNLQSAAVLVAEATRRLGGQSPLAKHSSKQASYANDSSVDTTEMSVSQTPH